MRTCWWLVAVMAGCVPRHAAAVAPVAHGVERDAATPSAVATGRAVLCMWGGYGPSPLPRDGRDAMHAIVLVDLDADRAASATPRSVELLDATGAVIGAFGGWSEPPTRLPGGGPDAGALWRTDGLPFDGALAQGTTRVRLHGRVDVVHGGLPTRCRATFDVAGHALVVERVIDGVWPSA